MKIEIEKKKMKKKKSELKKKKKYFKYIKFQKISTCKINNENILPNEIQIKDERIDM